MKKYKYAFLTFSLVIIILILSYLGVSFFTKGFNKFDYLLLNVLGDALLVGIVTHISSKTISMYISKKEFERNNKINITLNKNRNGIINYNDFMSLYQNKDVYFLMNESDKRIIEYVYKLYDCFLSIMKCEGVEKQLLDTLLNLPFCIDFIENNDIPDSYNGIIKKIDSHKRFDNISILKEVLSNEKDIKRLEKFSNIMSNIKHYEIANLNCVEGNQLLITANPLACKIPWFAQS